MFYRNFFTLRIISKNYGDISADKCAPFFEKLAFPFFSPYDSKSQMQISIKVWRTEFRQWKGHGYSQAGQKRRQFLQSSESKKEFFSFANSKDL